MRCLITYVWNDALIDNMEYMTNGMSFWLTVDIMTLISRCLYAVRLPVKTFDMLKKRNHFVEEINLIMIFWHNEPYLQIVVA